MPTLSLDPSDADVLPNAAMNPAIQFLAQLLLMLPVPPPADEQPGDGETAARYAASAKLPAGAAGGMTPFLPESLRAERANQVRIDDHITVRIIRWAPGSTLRTRPDRVSRSGVSRRRIGRCLPVAGIAGVQPSQGGELILYMRDRRVVSGILERACRARDFYSGFYLARSGDGKLCVDRDMLLSRNGANCKLAQIRELVLED